MERSVVNASEIIYKSLGEESNWTFYYNKKLQGMMSYAKGPF